MRSDGTVANPLPMRILAAAIAGALVVCAPPAAAESIDWHTSFEEGLEAAAASGKPMLVFVFISEGDDEYVGERQRISLPGDRSRQRRQELDRRRMIDRTLTDPQVMEAARAFEPVMLDLRLRANDDARRRLRVSPVVSEDADQRVGVYPITLFLDANGDELFRRHGHLPPEAYALQIRRAATLFEKLRAVTEEPGDPVRRRELGRAYMEMDFSRGDRFYQAAVRNLEEAIELDPGNATGAHLNARIDLAILRLPDNPAGSLDTLQQLAEQDERGERRLETEYYMAVANFVLNDHAAARRILSEFETDDRNSPYWDSPWTPQALGLLQHIRRMRD